GNRLHTPHIATEIAQIWPVGGWVAGPWAGLKRQAILGARGAASARRTRPGDQIGGFEKIRAVAATTADVRQAAPRSAFRRNWWTAHTSCEGVGGDLVTAPSTA